jgi:hypothetical protein
MLAELLRYLFRCTHANVTWPIRNVQRCLDCGHSRRMRMTSTGWIVTKWSADQPEQKLSEVVCIPQPR